MALATLNYQLTATELPYVLPAGTGLPGHFRIDALLGAGGFGISYLATDLSAGRSVALKEFFPADLAIRYPSNQVRPKSPAFSGDFEQALGQFVRDAETLARVNHDTVIRVHRTFRANDTGYIVQQFEEGLNYSEWLARLCRPPSQGELLAFIMPLLEALELVHRHHVLHRFIAPDNIIIRRNGSPVLTDFCSAGSVAGHCSAARNAVVRPGFSPLEQYGLEPGAQGPWTDIYALGATLYMAVTGKRPADAASRVAEDNLIPAEQAAARVYSPCLLQAIDHAMRLPIAARPASIAEWRGYFANACRETEEQSSGYAVAAGRALAPGPRSGPNVDLEMPVFLSKPSASEQDPSSKPSAPRRRPGGEGNGIAGPPLLAAPPPRPVQEQRSNVAPPSRQGPPPAAVNRVDAIEEALQSVSVLRPAPDRNPQVPVIGDAAPDRPQRLMERLNAVLDSENQTEADRQTRIWEKAVERCKALGRWFKRTLSARKLSRPPRKSAKKKTAFFRRKDRAADETPAAPPPARRIIETPKNPVRRIAKSPAPVSLWASSRLWHGKKLKIALYSIQFALAVAIASGVVYFSDDGASPQLASHAETRASAFVSTPGLVLKGHGGAVKTLAFSHDGRWIVSGSTDHSVKVWDSRNGQLARTLRHHLRAVVNVTVSGNLAISSDQFGENALWDIKSGRRLRTFEYGGGAVLAGLFMGRKNDIAIFGMSGNFKLWRRGSKTPSEHSLHGHEGAVKAVAYSPSGSFLATGSSDKTAKTWHAKTFKLIHTYRGHSGGVSAIAVSRDGKSLATGSDDRTVMVWSTQSGKRLHLLEGHAGAVTSVAFSPNGTRLASADSGSGSVRLWDLRSGKLLATLKGHGRRVRAVRFSPDGRRVFTGSDDKTIRAWNVGR